MKAKELEFIPVILGGDITTYSLARSFHEEYGIKSIAISTVKNWLNSYSSIIDNIIEPKMNDLDTFLKRLTSLGEQYLGRKKLILIACGDWYVRMIIENRDTLEKYYVIPYIQEELLNKLVLKDSFYDICEKTGVDYPKTFVYDVRKKRNWICRLISRSLLSRPAVRNTTMRNSRARKKFSSSTPWMS